METRCLVCQRDLEEPATSVTLFDTFTVAVHTACAGAAAALLRSAASELESTSLGGRRIEPRPVITEMAIFAGWLRAGDVVIEGIEQLGVVSKPTFIEGGKRLSVEVRGRTAVLTRTWALYDRIRVRRPA